MCLALQCKARLGEAETHGALNVYVYVYVYVVGVGVGVGVGVWVAGCRARAGWSGR